MRFSGSEDKAAKMDDGMLTPNGSNSLANEDDIAQGGTRKTDKKRAPLWYTDPCEQDLYFIKKQAIESIKATSGVKAIMNSSLFSANFGSHPSDKPCDSDIFVKNSTSIASDAANMENTGSERSAISQEIVNPLYYMNSGVQKPKVNQMAMPHIWETSSSLGHQNNLFPVSNYNHVDDSAASMDQSFGKIEKNLLSFGQATDIMYTNQSHHNVINNDIPSIGNNTLGVGNYNFDVVSEPYDNGNGEFVLFDPTYNKGQQNFLTFTSSGPSCNIVGKDSTVVPLQSFRYNEENSSLISMVSNCKKGDEKTISFGGVRDNKSNDGDLSGKLLSSYGLSLNQSSGSSGLKDYTEQLSVNAITTGAERVNNNNKETKQKKGPSSNFPSNVKALLSTGIFDGIVVKYVSWSREKNLRGVVNGTGYLCSCQGCNLSKIINAYEFERHAGCKTKHPNNHIYFENGKTVYAVVQELKSTPHEILFDVIQRVTGSKVHQENFQAWKASFQAATVELGRIYTKEKTAMAP